jgi:hypothetical protein
VKWHLLTGNHPSVFCLANQVIGRAITPTVIGSKVLAATDLHEACSKYCSFKTNCGEAAEISLQEWKK